MNISKEAIDVIKDFKPDADLEIKEELLSFHALNPFGPNCSSARLYMMSSHISQSLPIYGGEEKIIQSGLEKQFGQNTFFKKVEKEDFKVIKVIPRYRGISGDSVSRRVYYSIIGQYVESGEYDVLEIPYYNQVHIEFGFQYKWDEDLLEKLQPGMIIQKDTILADSPLVEENSGYKLGVNANLCLVTLPETAEDGMIISESLSKKMTYDVYETRHVEFGADNFPLNIYGDENNYKPFPEIGELVNKDSVLMVLRNYDPRMAHALTSRKDVMEYDPVFDKAVYVKGPGDVVSTSGGEVLTSEIIDIKAYSCPKYKRDVLTGTIDIVDKYVKGLKTYYLDIQEAYDEICKEHWQRFRNNDVQISERLHRLVVESMAVANKEPGRISYSYRNEQLDLYRATFIIKHRIRFNVGNKNSDQYGSKGVVVAVRPDSKMPYTIDEFGNKIIADIVMDPVSVVSRMNVGRLYEHYFNAMSRRTQTLMRNATGGKRNIKEISDAEVMKAFEILMGLLKIMDTEQYTEYSKIQKDMNTVRTIVDECLNKEVFLLYRVSSKKKPHEIVLETKDTIYYPKITPVYMETDNGLVEFENPIRIAPIYEISLNKTADNFLAVSTGKVNHYGILINNGSSSKHNTPWSENAVRGMGETEGRLFTAYGSRKFTAELKDRSSNIETHKHIYQNILDAKEPTNIDSVVDRDKQPYGDNASLQLLNNIFNAFGLRIAYTPENKR